jgi:hypothetical protein
MPAFGPPSRHLILAAALGSLLLAPALAQDHLAELRDQFNRESDPVRKAKILPKLGDAQFELLHKEIDAGNYAQVLQIMEAYRDEVRSAEAALKASRVNAERKPAGFKQLQMHVRKGIRELDQTILAVPVSFRAPFETIRQELISVDNELINLLFPHHPGKNSKRQKPKG